MKLPDAFFQVDKDTEKKNLKNQFRHQNCLEKG